jgi:hypothetical protein
MAIDVNAVRLGIKSAVESTGLSACTFIADSIEPPLFEVGEVMIDYDYAEHIDNILITCRLFVSMASDENSQVELDSFTQREGPQSIKAAIESDPRLAGACQSVRVERIDAYRVYTVATLRYIGAQMMVRILG